MARPKKYDHGQVVQRAVELFQKQGYQATSVRDLLTHLQLSSSSFYSAFGGKEQLYLEALRAHARVERQQLEAQLTAPGGIRENLRAVFAALVDDLSAKHPVSLTLRAGVEQAGSMPELFTLLSHYIEELIAMLASLLQSAQDRGEVELSFPAPHLARFLLFSAYNLGFLAKVGRDRERLEAYAAIALSVLDQRSTPHLVQAPA